MWEFVGRWLVVGGCSVAVLWLTGAKGQGAGAWLWAGLWLGFWNAALRPLVLRLGFAGGGVFGAVFLALGFVNALLFARASGWLLGIVLPEGAPLVVSALLTTLVGGVLSSRFRGADGRWHWISYHGSFGRRRPRAPRDHE